MSEFHVAKGPGVVIASSLSGITGTRVYLFRIPIVNTSITAIPPGEKDKTSKHRNIDGLQNKEQTKKKRLKKILNLSDYLHLYLIRISPLLMSWAFPIISQNSCCERDLLSRSTIKSYFYYQITVQLLLLSSISHISRLTLNRGE